MQGLSKKQFICLDSEVSVNSKFNNKLDNGDNTLEYVVQMPNAQTCILNSYKLYFPLESSTAIFANSIKKLQMNNCDIDNLNFFIKSEFTALEDLNLSNNKIINIEPLSIAKIPYLNRLNLLNNHIAETESFINIEKQTSLSRLILVNNCIATCKYLLILAKKGVSIFAIKNPIIDKNQYLAETAQDKTLEQSLKID